MKHVLLATKFDHANFPQTTPPFLPQTLQPLHQRAQAPTGSPASEDVQDSTVIIDEV